MTIPNRTLGPDNDGLSVPALGFGCMGMSEFYGARDDTQSLATLHRAIDLGVTFLDTADTYGLGHNEELIGRLMAERGRDSVTLATKFGIQREPGQYARGINNDPDYVRSACEQSLRRLGTDRIDLYYIHRVEPDRPIEEPMDALARLVADGKVRHVGLCEVNPETLRRAHAVHPVSAVQSEFSLWTRDPQKELLDVCRKLSIGFVAYSPLGRGFLTGTLTSVDTLQADDFRRANPRFSDDNLSHNLELLRFVRELADRKDCTPAQLALAWVLAQGEDVVPIPGTRRSHYLDENFAALDVKLSSDDLSVLDRELPIGAAAGERYTEEGMKGVNA